MKDKKLVLEIDKNIILMELLENNIKDYSKKTLKQYLKNNMVYVNKKIEHNPNTNLKKGDVVVFYFNKSKVNFKLQILYEDSDIIVINKPSGLLSVSNNKEKVKTAYHLVGDYLKDQNKNNKVFVIHRLDEKTSGVLMFAKSEKIKNLFQDNWNDIVKLREYFAVVPFKVPDKGRIESYLKMNHFQIVHSTGRKEEGKLAITNYEKVSYKNGLSLLKVNIETGRRNQIRVHMKENFAPICGDIKYGSKVNPINRLCLHASKLHMIDPRNKKMIKFETDIPEEILNLVK